MKVLAINTSPRHQGNTYTLLQTVLTELEKEGIETELFQAGGREVRGCRACNRCAEMKNGRCSIDDWVTELMPKFWEADGILLGSPTYFSDLTPELKSIIDRVGYVAGNNGNPLYRKVGAAVVAVRRAGSIHVLDSIQHFFLIRGMIIPGSTYWNMSLARQIGEAQRDEEGMRTMRELGKNMAWLLKKVHGGEESQ